MEAEARSACPISDTTGAVIVNPAPGVDNLKLLSDELTLVTVLREVSEITDWGTLGILLGLTKAEIKRCRQQSEGNPNMGFVQLWLDKGNASWAILVAALRDTLVNKVPIADIIASKYADKAARSVPSADPSSSFEQQNTSIVSNPEGGNDPQNETGYSGQQRQSIVDPIIAAQEKENREIAILKQAIQNCVNGYEFSNAQGIIIVIGIHGADGTRKDVQRVTETFKNLKFAVFDKWDITSARIMWLVKAAVQCSYPERYKFAAFYFAGHGGRNKSGEAYIKGLESHEFESEPVFVEQSIVIPWKSMRPDITRLFFFDCCQTQPSPSQFRDDSSTMKVSAAASAPNQVVAYATSFGQRSIGDHENGGIWTKHLCENLMKKLSIVEVLAETYEKVKNTRSDFQHPMTVSTVGAISLQTKDASNSTPTTSTKTGSKGSGENGPKNITDEKSWKFFFQNAAEQRPYLVATCIGIVSIAICWIAFVNRDNPLFDGTLVMSLTEAHPTTVLGMFITGAITVCFLYYVRMKYNN